MSIPAERGLAVPDDDFVLQMATLAEPFSFYPALTEKRGFELEGTGTMQAAGALPAPPEAVQTVHDFLTQLVAARLVCASDLQKFLREQNEPVDAGEAGLSRLATALVEQGLLTDYQVVRLRAGRTFGLVLGNYRILDRLGAGGMGVVYKAEHIYLKRLAAVKVLMLQEKRGAIYQQRFGSEMQAMAALQHPNIVAAFDAGEVTIPGSSRGGLRYLAMEYVPGQTLDVHVQQNGPLPVAQACRLICQAAEGLQHAHERGLVHRDIKPSNLILTTSVNGLAETGAWSQAVLVKILDFGLAQMRRRRHTEAFALLGTIDYVAPEQARDARSADIRADIYGLGGTLYWLLTGRKPFSGLRPPLEELLARQREKPTPLRQVRLDLPVELEAVVERMLAHDPNDRYATPLAVLSALTPFLDHSTAPAPLRCPPEEVPPRPVLLVSTRTEWRAATRTALEQFGLECSEASTVGAIPEQLRQAPCDAVLIDLHLPQHGGLRLCHRLRTEPAVPYLKVLLLTTDNPAAQLAAGLKVGADDAVPADIAAPLLAARVQALLRLRDSEERAARLAQQMLQADQQLQQALQRHDVALAQTQDVLIFALARMAELRGLESSTHLTRMQEYVRVLAEEALCLPVFAGRMDETFVRVLERCVPLHDLGMIALPDHVLLKPGKLNDEERAIMESHTILGAEILTAVARQHGTPLASLQLAAAIARHHHERFDGTGYPGGLAGDAIPLEARFVTLADVYDALRSKLVYKPCLSHAAACRLILEKSAGQFDPAVLLAFRRCEDSFAQIFAQRKE